VFNNRAMSRAVSLQAPTTEGPAQTQAILCGVCRGQSDAETRFSLSTSDLPYQYHSTNAPHLSSSTYRFYQKDKQVKPGKLKKAMFCRQLGNTGQKSTFTWSLRPGLWSLSRSRKEFLVGDGVGKNVPTPTSV
jgi:hypothetical protein